MIISIRQMYVREKYKPHLRKCLERAALSPLKPDGEVVPQIIAVLSSSQLIQYSNSYVCVQPQLLEDAPGDVFLLVYDTTLEKAERELGTFLKTCSGEPTVHTYGAAFLDTEVAQKEWGVVVYSSHYRNSTHA